MDATVMAQQAALLNVELNYPAFSVALISTPIEIGEILTQISVQEIVEEMLKKVCDVYSFGLYDRTAYLLCLHSQNDEQLVLKSLYEAAHMTQRMLQTALSCGLGLSCTSLDQLNLVYRQANEALEHNIVSEEQAVTCYSDIVPFEPADFPDWVSAAVPLEKAIRYGDSERIREETENLLQQIQKYRYSFNEYQLIILEIIFSLSKLYPKFQITSFEDLAGSKRMAMKILSLRTGEELNN